MKYLALLIVFCGIIFEGAVLAQSTDLDKAWEEYKVSDKIKISIPFAHKNSKEINFLFQSFDPETFFDYTISRIIEIFAFLRVDSDQ
jgi:hypothetical protein